MIAIGDKAPDFSLKDQNGSDVHLSDFSGKVILSFHPLAWTSVCAEQMKALEENIHTFEPMNTVAFGISVDSVPSKKAWAEHLGIKKTRLLSDFWPHGAVAQAYNIFRKENGFSERAVVVINEQQEVIFVKIYPISQLPDITEIITVLKS